MHRILAAALPGARVDVRDDTHKHLGHNAAVGHDGAHFKVRIVWGGFADMPRLARHRMVHGLVAEAWGDGRIHSLSLRLMVAGEAEE